MCVLEGLHDITASWEPLILPALSTVVNIAKTLEQSVMKERWCFAQGRLCSYSLCSSREPVFILVPQFQPPFYSPLSNHEWGVVVVRHPTETLNISFLSFFLG